MGWLTAIKKKAYPQATKVRQLEKELRRVTKRLMSREGEVAEALVVRPTSINNSAVQKNHG